LTLIITSLYLALPMATDHIHVRPTDGTLEFFWSPDIHLSKDRIFLLPEYHRQNRKVRIDSLDEAMAKAPAGKSGW